jgi:hypothetical protein
MNEYKIIGIGTAINLLSEVFGTNYVIPQDANQSNEIGAYNVTVISSEPTKRISQFGTPVFGNFKTEAHKNYLVYDVNNKLSPREYDEFEFPLATIVDFERKKNIVITQTIGGLGSVKETMGLDDWNINIRGVIVFDESRQRQKTVHEQQYALDRLNEIVGSIGVSGKIFGDRYINHIVIQDLKYSAVQGKPGLVQYEINALSDEEFFL